MVKDYFFGERAKDNTTDLAIFAAGAPDVIKGDRRCLTRVDAIRLHARCVIPGLTNGELGKMLGRGDDGWTKLWADDAAKLELYTRGNAEPDPPSFVGRTVSGLVPLFESDGEMTFVQGTFKISVDSSNAGRFVLSETAASGGGNVIDNITAANVRRLIAAADARDRTSSDPTDTTFDAQDYEGVLSIFQASGHAYLRGALEPHAVSARLLSRAGAVAGAGPEVAPDATDRQLRVSALEVLVYLSHGLRRMDTSNGELDGALDTIVKRDEFLKKMKLAMAPAAGGGGGGGGIGGGGVDGADNGAGALRPADRELVLQQRGQANAPRYYALKTRAVSDEEWLLFCERAMVYCVPVAERRPGVLAHERTRAGAIEAWLRSMGESADKEILATLEAGQDAGDLLQTCIELMPAAPASLHADK